MQEWTKARGRSKQKQEQTKEKSTSKSQKDWEKKVTKKQTKGNETNTTTKILVNSNKYKLMINTKQTIAHTNKKEKKKITKIK